MEITRSATYLFKSSCLYRAKPDGGERWFDSVPFDPPYDDECRHPLNADVQEWLDNHTPKLYRIPPERAEGGPDESWHRPIYFKTRAAAMMFKMAFQGAWACASAR